MPNQCVGHTSVWIEPVTMDLLWDKRRNKGLKKPLVCADFFLLEFQAWCLQTEWPLLLKPSFTCLTADLSSTVAAPKSPGRLLKTDEHLSLGPIWLRTHLHAVQQICIKLEPRELGWVSRPHSFSTLLWPPLFITIYKGGRARQTPS